MRLYCIWTIIIALVFNAMFWFALLITYAAGNPLFMQYSWLAGFSLAMTFISWVGVVSLITITRDFKWHWHYRRFIKALKQNNKEVELLRRRTDIIYQQVMFNLGITREQLDERIKQEDNVD